MSKKLIDRMVDRFLGWKLPQDFGPDCGISFSRFHPNGTTRYEPVGTNLLTADQARQMFEYVLDNAQLKGSDMISLGQKYKDKITGFEGVATGYVQYISGCNQALIAPPVGSDGSLRDSQWFDVQRLEAQESERIILDNGATPGCDRAAPRR